jgi:hypothetical protein
MGDSPEAIEGQAKLFRVLIAYAKYNPKIGYSQGGKADWFIHILFNLLLTLLFPTLFMYACILFIIYSTYRMYSLFLHFWQEAKLHFAVFVSLWGAGGAAGTTMYRFN